MTRAARNPKVYLKPLPEGGEMLGWDRAKSFLRILL